MLMLKYSKFLGQNQRMHSDPRVHHRREEAERSVCAERRREGPRVPRGVVRPSVPAAEVRPCRGARLPVRRHGELGPGHLPGYVPSQSVVLVLTCSRDSCQRGRCLLEM